MCRCHDEVFRLLQAVQMLFAYEIRFPAVYPVNDGQEILSLPAGKKSFLAN
jgi:hypothetical protein